MGLRTSPTQEEREDGGADRLEREGEASGFGRYVGLHERLGDKAVGRADERERNDNDDLARRAGKREAAKGKCGDTREQAAEAQLPNAQSQRIDFFDKALGDDNVAGIDKGRERMMIAPGFRLVKSAPESSNMPQVTMAVPMSTLRSGARRSRAALANGTITTVRLCKKPAVEAEVRLEPRHMQVISVAMMAPMMAARTIRSRLMRTACLWKSSRQATKAMMQRSATMLVAFMLSMPVFMRGYEKPHATGTENESAIAFLRSMGLLLLQNGFAKRILLPDVDVVKRMYLQYD